MRQLIQRNFTVSDELVVDATPMNDYYTSRSLSSSLPSERIECANCKAQVKTLYQSKTCKACLLADFKPLRPMIDAVIGNRYSNNRSSLTISASVTSTGRELFEGHDTLELVEPATPSSPLAKGGLGGIIPWLHYNRKRYMSSTYPRKY